MNLTLFLLQEGLAEYIGGSKETIYWRSEHKKIPAHRIGKLWKFKPSGIDQWVMSGGATTLDAERGALK